MTDGRIPVPLSDLDPNRQSKSKENHPEWDRGYMKGFADGRTTTEAENDELVEIMTQARDATSALIAEWIERGMRIDEPLRSQLGEQIRRGDWIMKT
jgi:U3 small nucleolar RNA-associated protein 14